MVVSQNRGEPNIDPNIHLKILNPRLIGSPKAVPLILRNPPPHEATARGQTAALAAGLGAGCGVLQNCVGVWGSGGVGFWFWV